MATIPEALALAQQALQAGDRSRSESILRQILHVAPDNPEALNGLGTILFYAGQLEAAAEHIRRAIAAADDNPAYHANLNLVYRQLKRPQEAVSCARRALALDPDSAALHNALAVTLQEAGSLEEAVASFRDSIARNPHLADVHYNLARTLFLLFRIEESIAEYRIAARLAPGDFEAHNNLGTLLDLQGRHAEAMACYEETLRLRPDSAEAHRNRALLRLYRGDYAGGFAEYEWRWRMNDVVQPNYPRPRWQGEPLAGRTILLWSEQGIGDVVQFVRYAALVKQTGARVLFEAPPGLHPLFENVAGIDRLVVRDAVEELFDYQIPLMSLPLVLGTTIDTIPAQIPYLFAELDRVAHWRKTMDVQGQFGVGIAWQGNPKFLGDVYRSVPLCYFAPLADCPGVKLFCLQKGHGREQLPALAEQIEIVDLAPTLDEGSGAFLDTAAVMMNLDLVITSDTSIAHVAGALGAPVWVPLSAVPNWRWHAERSDSPWYPTMRLFRQSRLGEWDDVFAEIAAELRSLSSPSPPS